MQIMEIFDELEIEILCTIQKIKNMEEILRRHSEAKSEDLILNQYQFIKADLCQQLAVLLSVAIGTKVQIAA